MAEDNSFGERVRQSGFSILPDTTIRLRHIGTFEYRWEEAGFTPQRYGRFDLHLPLGLKGQSRYSWRAIAGMGEFRLRTAAPHSVAAISGSDKGLWKQGRLFALESGVNRGSIMQVAVVTPCYKPRIEWLTRCVQSVARQTVPCTHILVSDGDSTAYDLDGICIQRIRLPRSHRDYGDTPRAIGSVSAVSQGFDAIAWLDADNWYAADHVESLVELHHQTKACVCTSGRMLCQENGQPLGACYEVNGVDFVDTNCFLITREAFQLIPVWFLMDSNLHVGGDRVVWHYVRDWKLAHAHTGRPTIYYRTQLRTHYQYFGVPAPKDARDLRVPVRT